jgi:membrane-associated PAP2 superfamily phosphatase
MTAPSATAVLRPGRPLAPTLAASLAALAAILLWEAARLDLPLAMLAGDAHGFALREHWLFATVLHEGGRRLSWLAATALCLGVWWPFGPLRRLTTSRRIQLAVSGLLAAGVISLLKSGSATSCPWDLHEFGGLAHYVSHWHWREQDGGSGRCFPAGHASSGFAFIGGWFVFSASPVIARRWLLGSLAAGLLFGLAQQVRGAHFMSHTLWTGWICWITAWAVDAVWPVIESRLKH